MKTSVKKRIENPGIILGYIAMIPSNIVTKKQNTNNAKQYNINYTAVF